MAKVKLSVYIPVELDNEIRQKAFDQRRSKSDLVTELLSKPAGLRPTLPQKIKFADANACVDFVRADAEWSKLLLTDQADVAEWLMEHNGQFTRAEMKPPLRLRFESFPAAMKYVETKFGPASADPLDDETKAAMSRFLYENNAIWFEHNLVEAFNKYAT